MSEVSKPHSEPDEPKLSDYIDMEAYDVVSGETYRNLVEQLEAAWTALELVGAIQRTRLGWYRDQGVVFKSKLNRDPDPDDWESIAFWTYTDLCEAESIARATLEESNPASIPGYAHVGNDGIARWVDEGVMREAPASGPWHDVAPVFNQDSGPVGHSRPNATPGQNQESRGE